MVQYNDKEIERVLNNAFRPYDCDVQLINRIYIGGVRRNGVRMFSINMFATRAARPNDLETYIVKARKELAADGAIFDTWTMPGAGY